MSTKRADGEAGARRATAVISIALCAESSAASLNEDYAKVDIKFSYRDAFDLNNLITHHCQVKSGLSFKAKSSNETDLYIQNVDKATIESLKSSAGIIAWVPPKPSSKVFWYVADPRKKAKTPIKIPRTQFVRPSIRYDLSRVISYSKWHGGSPKQDVAALTSLDQVVKRAKKSYKELSRRERDNPLVGKLYVTRFAWRHVTRRSKVTKRRIFSLRIVPYLKGFLEQAPDRYTIGQPKFRKDGRNIVETRHLLCWYRDALTIDGDSYALLVRIKEDVSYPETWEKYPLGIEDVSQKATLASWWAKIENKGVPTSEFCTDTEIISTTRESQMSSNQSG